MWNAWMTPRVPWGVATLQQGQGDEAGLQRVCGGQGRSHGLIHGGILLGSQLLVDVLDGLHGPGGSGRRG